MKRTGFAAAIAAIVMCASLTSCGGGKSSSESASTEDTSASVETTAAEETEASSEEATAAEKTTAAVTSAEEKQAETTAESTSEPATEAPEDEGGYADVTTLAQDFYNAYLGHNAEAVYELFDKEEIEGYSKLIADELDGKDPAVVFSKKAVVNAIDQSMTSVSEIMDAYSDSGQDEWSVEITADDLEDVEEEQLDDFNGDLSTSYTEAKIINYVLYKDKSNDQSFTGNSSAFLNRNGKWYLSYSSLMQSELINYIDL